MCCSCTLTKSTGKDTFRKKRAEKYNFELTYPQYLTKSLTTESCTYEEFTNIHAVYTVFQMRNCGD